MNINGLFKNLRDNNGSRPLAEGFISYKIFNIKVDCMRNDITWAETRDTSERDQ